jgi:protein-histidine pros-kinase
VRSTKESKAEDKFRGLLESAPGAMVILNAEGKITLIMLRPKSSSAIRKTSFSVSASKCWYPSATRKKHPEHRTSYFGSPRPRRMGGGLLPRRYVEEDATAPAADGPNGRAGAHHGR